MAKQTLLTEEDVIQLSKVPKQEFPRTDLGDIYQVERTERRVTIGASLYDSMLADLADYSAAPAWASGSSHDTGDHVVYEGVVYTSLVDANTSEPPTRGKWKKARKFTTDEYEDLWCLFLGRYLALHVIASTIPKQAVKLTGSGVIQSKSSVHGPADKPALTDLQSYVLSEVVRVFENMHEYLKGSTATEYSGYAGAGASLCDLEDLYTLTGGERFFYGTIADDTETEEPADRHRYNANIYRLG